MNLRTLSITEAVKETGIPRSAIYRLLDEGKVAGNRSGNRWRISEASLSAWINRTPNPSPTSTARAFPEIEERYSFS